MIPPTAILVFAKAPVPGDVKTRLIPALGAAGAARLAERLIERTLVTAVTAGIGPVTLYGTPDAEHPRLVETTRIHAIPRATQGDGDLGKRMADALTHALADSPQALLIGCDCPPLHPEDLREAARALADGAGATILPAEDGGYVLVGGRRNGPSLEPLFQQVHWGSASVLARTRHNAHAAGITLHEGRLLWDVDRPEDLPRLSALVPEGLPAPISAPAAPR